MQVDWMEIVSTLVHSNQNIHTVGPHSQHKPAVPCTHIIIVKPASYKAQPFKPYSSRVPLPDNPYCSTSLPCTVALCMCNVRMFLWMLTFFHVPCCLSIIYSPVTHKGGWTLFGLPHPLFKRPHTLLIVHLAKRRALKNNRIAPLDPPSFPVPSGTFVVLYFDLQTSLYSFPVPSGTFVVLYFDLQTSP